MRYHRFEFYIYLFHIIWCIHQKEKKKNVGRHTVWWQQHIGLIEIELPSFPSRFFFFTFKTQLILNGATHIFLNNLLTFPRIYWFCLVILQQQKNLYEIFIHHSFRRNDGWWLANSLCFVGQNCEIHLESSSFHWDVHICWERKRECVCMCLFARCIAISEVKTLNKTEKKR